MGDHEEFYGMPAFPMLAVEDLPAASRWYQVTFGFRHVSTTLGPDGRPVVTHVRWAKYADVLLWQSDQTISGPRGTGVTLFFAIGQVEPYVDALAERVAQAGGMIVSGPADTPWGTRDVTVLDPDGYQLTFTGAQRPESAAPPPTAAAVGAAPDGLQAGVQTD